METNIPLMKTYIAGIPHRKPDLTALAVGDTVIISPEPENKFDPNAIKVLSSNAVHLGYIPKLETHLWSNIALATIAEIVPERKWKEVVIEAPNS